MAKTIKLDATMREGVGKGAARAVRREGGVPAVIYGGDEAPATITLAKNKLISTLNQGGFYTNITEIKIGNDTHRVLARDIQWHPVYDSPEHVDFLRVTKRTMISVEVGVNFINEDAAPGLNEEGGILNVVRHAIEVRCSAISIPEEITVDLTGMTMGDSVHMQSLNLPEGVQLTTDEDYTVATIAAPKAAPVEDEEGEEGEEADLEGTVGEEAAEAAEGEEEEKSE